MILLDPYRFQSGGASNDFLTSLHSAWSFEEASGTLNDRTSTYTATNNGATYGATGIDGDCLSFDNVDDYVDLASAGDYKFMHDGSDWSISLWYKTNNADAGDTQFIFGTHGILSHQIGVGFLIDDRSVYSRNRALYFEMCRGVAGQRVYRLVHNEFFPNDTDWHMVTMTLDASLGSNQVKIYLDGSFVVATSKTGHSYSTANEYERRIGRNGPATQGGFDGLIDEVYFWEDRVLDGTEISDIYNSGSGLFYDNFG